MGGPILPSKPLTRVTKLLSHRCLKGPLGLMPRRPPVNSQGTSYGLQCQRTCWVRGGVLVCPPNPASLTKCLACCAVIASLQVCLPWELFEVRGCGFSLWPPTPAQGLTYSRCKEGRPHELEA